jgi:DNA-binding NtrC family response regulator
MTAYRGLHGKTVLIVEDHSDYREMLALTLRTAGSRVVTASNVSEARREVVAYRPDAVISDLRLMDGTGLASVSAGSRASRSAATPRCSSSRRRTASVPR